MTETEICNLAMIHLGTKTISNYATDQTENARLLRIVFESSVNKVLEDHNWNFATQIEALAEIDQTIPGYDYVYAVPSDCLYIQKILDTEYSDTVYEYEVIRIESLNATVILTNLEAAYIKYTSKIFDYGLFNSNFINALSYLLAHTVAMPLTGDANKQLSMLQFYERAISQAKIKNSQQQYRELSRTSDILDSRG